MNLKTDKKSRIFLLALLFLLAASVIILNRVGDHSDIQVSDVSDVAVSEQTKAGLAEYSTPAKQAVTQETLSEAALENTAGTFELGNPVLAQARSSWGRYQVVGQVDPMSGQYRRASFYRTVDFKYDLVRFDETFDSDPSVNADAQLISQEVYVADHFIARVLPEQEGLIAALMDKYKELSVRKELNGGEIVLIEFPLQNFEVNEFAFWKSRLKANGLKVEKDRLTFSTATPADPEYPNQWALDNTGQTAGTVDADIDADLAWDIQTGSSDVIVAVIDTGVDLDHQDLVTNIWSLSPTVKGFDFVNGGTLPYDTSLTGHGTHVAGVIGAKANNGRGIAGLNWNVKIMPIRVLNDAGVGTNSDLIAAINYAVSNGASIINLSLGGGGGGSNSDDDPLYAEIRAARDALPKGVLVVAAAGNDGADMETTPFYPAAYSLSNIISVAASDHDDAVASFSNFGSTTVDLAAPGDDIVSTLPDNTVGSLSGTSMAAPHVSGVAALIKAQDPTLTYLEIKNLILNTVDVAPAFNGITVTGGRLNANNALLNFGSASAVVSNVALRPLGGVNNGDDVLTSGEDMLVDLAVVNYGSATATNVSVTLAVTQGNAFVTLVSPATKILADLPAGGEVFLKSAFQLHAEALGAFDFEQDVEIELTVNYDPAMANLKYANFSIYQSASLSGIVVDGVDGVTPIEGATVSITADLPAGEFELTQITGVDGLYNFPLFTGLVNISASADGYLPSIPAVVDLNPVEPNQVFDITLGQGDFTVLTPTINITVPANEIRTVDARIQNTGTSPNPLDIKIDLSETDLFFGGSQMYGLKGVGTINPVVALLNPYTLSVEEEIQLSLPSGNFAIDFAYHDGSIWILTTNTGGTGSVYEYSTATWTLEGTSELDMYNNGIVYVESILSMPVPAPTADDPSAMEQRLGLLAGHNFFFNASLYLLNPYSETMAERTNLVGELEDNLVWLWNSYDQVAGTNGIERDTFFHGRGLDLNEWTIDGESSLTEVSTKQLFDFDPNFNANFTGLTFPLRDVRSLAYFDQDGALYIFTQGVTGNIIKVNWDQDVYLNVFDSPTGVERITTGFSQSINWLQPGYKSGNIPEGTTTTLPIDLIATDLTDGTTKSGNIRVSSFSTDTVGYIAVNMVVGDLDVGTALLEESGFNAWYQSYFGMDPTEGILDLDDDNDNIGVLLEYVVGGNPLVQDTNTNQLLPRIVFDQDTNDIYVKFRRRTGLPDGFIDIDGKSNFADPWTTLVEDTDYEVIFVDPVDDDFEEVTISTNYNGSGFFQLVVNP